MSRFAGVVTDGMEAVEPVIVHALLRDCILMSKTTLSTQCEAMKKS